MNYQKYAQILKSVSDPFFDAPPEAWLQFVQVCEKVQFKRGQTLKEENSKEKYFYFILSGSTGIFLWKENNYVCLDFAFDHQFSTDYLSMMTKASSPLKVIALEDTEMLRMPLPAYERLTQKTVGKIIRMISAEHAFIDKQQQQIDLLTKTAEERYEILQERFPNISNRIAQKYIASYLGITPQSLSRIRKVEK